MLVKRFAFLALFISAICFATLIDLGNDWNWSPVQIPFPGPGLEVCEPFRISSAGEFRLGVSLPRINPASPIDSPPLPDIHCDLQLEIKSQDGSMIRQSIKKLHPIGDSPGPMDDYRAEPLALPHSGDYTFCLRNQGESEFLCKQGAGIIFSRFQKSTEWVLRNVFLRAVGWTFLVLGFLAAATSEILDYKKRHSIGKEGNLSRE